MNFSEKFKYCPACGSPEFVVNNAKSKLCETCGFVYYINPSAATAAFIRNSGGDLLVCRRANEPAKGTLDLPGGFADPNETIEQCVVREVSEETGLKVQTVSYLFSLPNEYSYSGMIIPTMDMFFECTFENTCSLRPADDVEACFFIPYRELNPALFGLKSVRKAVQFYIDSIAVDKKEIFFA